MLNETSYHGYGAVNEIVNEVKNRGFRKALIVTDSMMIKLGNLDKVLRVLNQHHVGYSIYAQINSEPCDTMIIDGLKQYQAEHCDFLIALGGGSAMDAGKIMWVLYEHPEVDFMDMAMRFIDIRKRVYTFPKMGEKAYFIAVPTSSGTGSEVTPFAVITDQETGIKYPLADFNITPDVAIVDPALAETMPKKLTAHTGMDAMTHAIEAYVSTLHCDYTDPLALHAIKMISRDLVASYNGDMKARASMHNAQCLAGMAFSNALLGIVHSMAHKTGAAYSGGHIVHGCANAMYLPKVIKYNSKNPEADKRYAEIAAFLGLEPTTDALIAHIKNMNKQLDIPTCIRDYEGGIIDEKEFLEKLPQVAELAVGDACTGSNPREITPAQMEKLLKCCFYDEEVDF